jgi:restriction system protein
VTGGTFTPEARSFALESKVQLVDGDRLAELLRKAKSAGRNESAEQMARARAAARAAGAAPAEPELTPSCPACQSQMVRRMAKKGPNAGTQFWGCSRFPACKGTR